ncbi:MAG: lipoyl(octanoyl) transferase LipB [Verrucomicrobia bacterium]|nr:lipoyl(octanoyl) transferase LipB [Verrucomicrobiota bacterium]
MTVIEIVDWGRTEYQKALAMQQDRVQQRIHEAATDALVFTEHEPVYTIGARQGADDHLVADEVFLAREGITVARSNRGGDITYHGPGQIVGYPIISLRNRGKDLHAYLRDLEEVLIRTVRHFGLNAGRREGKTGIWLQDRKIAAIGVAVKQWVTYHGFALNVNPVLDHFKGIIPCGITDGTVTSMSAELGRAILPVSVKPLLALEFQQVFADTIDPDGRT